jgi:hypothetical protein
MFFGVAEKHTYPTRMGWYASACEFILGTSSMGMASPEHSVWVVFVCCVAHTNTTHTGEETQLWRKSVSLQPNTTQRSTRIRLHTNHQGRSVTVVPHHPGYSDA